VVELSWEPAAPDPTKYFDSTSSGGGMLGFSLDSEARREEEERVESLVRINLKVRVPKLDAMSLGMRLVARETGEALFDWTYQKNRSSEALSLASLSEYRMTQGGGPSDQPEFTLKDKVYEAECFQTYSKSILTRSAELRVDFRVANTQTVSGDSLFLDIEDQEAKGEAHE